MRCGNLAKLSTVAQNERKRASLNVWVCVCVQKRREAGNLKWLRKLPLLAGWANQRKNCWFSYQTKMPALAQKNHHRRRFAIYRRHSIQWDCMQIRTEHTHTHTHIYLYRVQSMLSIYIYILVPRIFLCAFDAQHKLTLQTFCGLKSAASGTLSMASECNTLPPPPLGRVWGVASIVLNSYKAALNAPSCLSICLVACCLPLELEFNRISYSISELLFS